MMHIQTIANTPSDSPIGLGLRSPHLDDVLHTRPAVAFFEAHPENFMLDRNGFSKLVRIRNDYPLSLHAVGLSLGTKGGVDPAHLARLRYLVQHFDPFLVSDHLSWSVTGGVYLNDLLPLPYTKEAFDVVARNIEYVQSALKRQILIENPSAYLRFESNEFEEPEFLRMLVKRTGCGLLLDVNNVYVSAANLGFDTNSYLAAFPFEAVKEIHLAGHTRNEVDGKSILIDNHGSRVPDEVLELCAHALPRAAEAVTLIEWDSDIPALAVLLEERDRATRVASSTLSLIQETSLEALQSNFARRLLHGDEIPEIAISGNFSVHRNNVRESLTAALRTVYTAVEQLVGEAFFRQCARQFIAAHPPTMPSLSGYGEVFPQFLAGLPSCAGLPYLADVARLEWLASRASLVNILPPLVAEGLSPALAKDPALLTFTAQPGLSYLASPFPVDSIFGFARARGNGDPPPLDGDPVFLEIMSDGESVMFRRLDEPEFVFRRALAMGADIGTAAEQALRIDPLFVLFTSLRSLIADGIFTDCILPPSQSHIMEVNPCLC